MKTKEERNPNFSKDLEDHKEAVIKVKTDATKAEREAIKEKEKQQKREELAKKQEWDEFNALQDELKTSN